MCDFVHYSAILGLYQQPPGDRFPAEWVAVAAIKGEKTLIALAQDFDLDPSRIKPWRDQLLEGATGVFGEAARPEPDSTIDLKTLHAKIGELTLENDFLSGARDKAGLVPSAKR